MTAQLKKTEQTRLHSCVLSQPKGPKIRKKLRKHARVALKISDIVADTSARVENAPETLKAQRKTRLFGKYRLRSLIAAFPSRAMRFHITSPKDASSICPPGARWKTSG